MNGKADLLPWSIYRLVVVRMGRSLKDTSKRWVRRTGTLWMQCMGSQGVTVVFPGFDWESYLGR